MMRFFTKFSTFKVDWNNQLVGFIATILGILIAFQMEDWKNNAREKAKLQDGLASLKEELKLNKSQMESSLLQITEFNEWLAVVLENSKTDSTITCTKAQWNKISARHPKRFENAKIVNELNDSTLEIRYNLLFDFQPTEISKNSWEACKYNGLLNSLPQNQLVTFIWLYEELNKTWVDAKPSDFYVYVTNNSTDFDLAEFRSLTEKIEIFYSVKKHAIDSVYQEILNY